MGALKRDELRETLVSLRRQLVQAFRPDTAAQGFPGQVPSSGHCAAVATIVHELLGGEIISTLVAGHSHWLNRVRIDDRPLDIDLTGDQFGRPALQVEEAGQLYSDVRVRETAELAEETLRRALLLAERAKLLDAARGIEATLMRRSGTQGSP